MNKTVDITSLRKKDPNKFVDLLYTGQISLYASPNLEGAKRLASAFNSSNKAEIYNFFKNIQKKRVDIIADEDTVICIQNIYDYRYRFVRPIDTWEKKFYNPQKQLTNLTQHVFSKYKVPTFMDKVWFNCNSGLSWQKHLYIWLAQGNSIRDFHDGPIRLSKKEAPLFYTAPDDYTVNEAYKWAQVMAMGGEPRIMPGILGTQHLSGFPKEKENQDFWFGVLRFFVSQPMLDVSQIGPICDFIAHKRAQSRYHMAWYPLEKRYIQVWDVPLFEMKGRTIQSLIRGMEEWHAETQLTKRGKISLVWDPIPIPNFTYSTGKDDKKVTYTIKQITSEKELRAEGKRMHHCVGSYASSCHRGACSIWSMEESRYMGAVTKPLLTIELQKDKTISQIRGLLNRKSNKYEDSIISQWVVKNNLRFSRWV